VWLGHNLSSSKTAIYGWALISSEQGRLTKQTLETLVPDAKLQHAYICGPTQFMSDVTEYLVALGVSAANIHTESFEF